jgi:hypothetical protein
LAGERLPQPLAAVGVVASDIAKRVLFVRLSDLETGHAQSLYRQSFAALKNAEESGWSNGAATLWGATDGADRVAFATAGDGGLLKFSFKPGEPSFVQLVGKPGLTAIVVMDRSACRFLSVKFRNRQS